MNKKLRTIHPYYIYVFTIKKIPQCLKIEIKGKEIIKISFTLIFQILYQSNSCK